MASWKVSAPPVPLRVSGPYGGAHRGAKAVTAVTSTLKAGGSRFKADRQLTVRMLVTVFLLGLLYVAFIGALLVLLKSTLLVVVLAADSSRRSTGSPTGSPCTPCTAGS